MNRQNTENKTVGIVGGGSMGSSLARYFLTRGFTVTLVEAESSLVEKVRQKIQRAISRETEKGKVRQEDASAWLSNLRVDTDMSFFKEAGMVIEAVPEEMTLKKRVLTATETWVQPDTIIASNTSALPISALAVCLSRPERFLGTHFFNPPHVMPLVEVVPGIDTAPEVLCRVLEVLSAAGKSPIHIKECPGFLVNRILGAYMNEVMRLLDGTAGIEDIEEAAKQLGLPMGPVTLGEMVGWDIIHASNRTLAAYYGERFEVPPLLAGLDAQGRHGIKTAKGLLDHSVRPPRPTEDLVPVSRNLDKNTVEAVKSQVLYAVIAEGLRCMDEGVAEAGDLDRALVMGAGLPKGPLAWADELGLARVLDHLEGLSRVSGSRFWPAPILRTYVLAGHTGVSAGRGLAGRY